MKHDDYMKIGHAMMDFSRRFKAFMKAELADMNMNFTDGMTLLSIYGDKERTAESLLDAVSCDKSVMTRTLQKLEKEGLVSRKHNPDDGRSWLFCVTEEGRESAGTVIDAIRKWSEESFGNMSEKDVKLLLELLLKL